MRRKLFIFKEDEENSGFGIALDGFPLNFGLWTKRFALEFREPFDFEEAKSR